MKRITSFQIIVAKQGTNIILKAIYVDLTVAHDVVPMDQGVDQCLSHGMVGVVQLVHPVLRLFAKRTLKLLPFAADR